MIEPSSVEGRRFGLRAGRIEAERIDARALQHEVVEGGWDWLILRLPTGRESIFDALRTLGLEPQPADTLMTWSLDLQRAGSTPLQGIEMRPAVAADLPAIAALVRSIFQRYPNHYTANPWLDPALALEGYVEWALAHVEHPQRLCWLASIEGEIAGLSCSRHDPERGICVGALHGVDPRFAGRGVYRGMIEASVGYYRGAGYREFRIATQAGNHTVQNLWARLGLRLVGSQSTWHLMPLLGLVAAAESTPLGREDDPLRALIADAANSGTPRRCVYRLPHRPIAGATQIRRAVWLGTEARLREVGALFDAEGRLLAWQHSERAAPPAPPAN